jgi:hypothetical protein
MEQYPNGERLATSEQAQSVLSEIERILENVPAMSEGPDMPQEAAGKFFPQKDIMFQYYPNGVMEEGKNEALTRAVFFYDNEDGSSTHYKVALDINKGLMLSRSVLSASFNEDTERAIQETLTSLAESQPGEPTDSVEVLCLK